MNFKKLFLPLAFLLFVFHSCNNDDNINTAADDNEIGGLATEQQVFNWLAAQQLPNGLLESIEDGNIVSLYDNAMAALVFFY